MPLAGFSQNFQSKPTELCVCSAAGESASIFTCRSGVPRHSEVVIMESFQISSKADAPFVASQCATPSNAVEGYKASMDGDGLRILEHLPQMIGRGVESLTPAEKELLKWVGIFYRRPTPGKFMMRIRMPNG